MTAKIYWKLERRRERMVARLARQLEIQELEETDPNTEYWAVTHPDYGQRLVLVRHYCDGQDCWCGVGDHYEEGAGDWYGVFQDNPDDHDGSWSGPYDSRDEVLEAFAAGLPCD